MGVLPRSGVLLLAVVLAAAAMLPGCHGTRDAGVGAAALSPCPCQAGLHGDLNGSGTPEITDAIGILRIVVGLDPANALADCDCDGLTGITDAIALLRCLVGLDDWPIHCPGEPFAEVTGPDGQTLVWVPAGSFMMGSNEVFWWEDERPEHKVTLPRLEHAGRPPSCCLGQLGGCTGVLRPLRLRPANRSTVGVCRGGARCAHLSLGGRV
jgi:formylglycine-generating enzyme required for sulfatase activity